MFDEHSTSTLAVFSHPNHELAILGLLERLRPKIIYLTDGGGGPRIAESQKWLASVDLLKHATFLNFTEPSFYDSLCKRNHTFYEEVTDQVLHLVDSWRPTQVLCDAVEFYNPVHDLTLPIVRAALGTTEDVAVFEVPLMYQRSSTQEEYEVQRFPISRRAGQIEIRLTDEERDRKLDARDSIYTTIMNEMGGTLKSLPDAHAALEVLGPAGSKLANPVVDQVLRYEWRGALLLDREEIQEVITYENHYAPIASTLLSRMASRNRAYEDLSGEVTA